jgi:hypothetical protein
MVERWLTMKSGRSPMRTMDPREKVRFENNMKVAYFLLGSGTVGGDQRDWVGFQRLSRSRILEKEIDGSKAISWLGACALM